MKKYTLRCLLQHLKMFITLVVIILVSSFLSFKMAEFSCWLKQCDCMSLLNQETIITRSEYKSSKFQHCFVFVWSEKLAPMRTIEQRPCLGPEIKIMWKEKLVEPLIDYMTSVNVPYPSVLN